MEFNIRNPLHIVGLIVLLLVCFLLFVEPVLTYFGLYPLYDAIDFSNITIAGTLISLLVFIGMPLLWYVLVNKYDAAGIKKAVKLRAEGVDRAILWGVAGAIITFVVVLCIAFVLVIIYEGATDAIGNVMEDSSELTVLAMLLVTVQALGAEFFFRGFLLDKIEGYAGGTIAVIITALLYSLVHLTYGNMYPVLIPVIMGIVLGYIVIKTRNLYAAFIAQIVFNFIIFVLYFATQTLQG